MSVRLTGGLVSIVVIGVGAAGSARAQAPPPNPLQIQAPVYRAGTYVVPIGIVLNYKKQPWTGLTTADFMVVVDRTPVAPLELQHDDQAANHYTIFFQPPDSTRDGKAHVLQIRVKKPHAKDWTTLPFKAPLTLPERDGG